MSRSGLSARRDATYARGVILSKPSSSYVFCYALRHSNSSSLLASYNDPKFTLSSEAIVRVGDQMISRANRSSDLSISTKCTL